MGRKTDRQVDKEIIRQTENKCTHEYISVQQVFFNIFIYFCRQKEGHPKAIYTEGEITSIQIILEARLCQDFLKPTQSRFGCTVHSSSSTAKRWRLIHLCCWFRRPPLSSTTIQTIYFLFTLLFYIYSIRTCWLFENTSHILERRKLRTFIIGSD